MLTCCCKHRCRLLETCGHCGELIPLFRSPFTVGNCPRCNQSLKLCTAVSVAYEAELEVASHVHDDIVSLLTPQPWEAESSRIIKRVGRRFAHMRQIKRLTAVEVARQIGVTLTVVEGIERGDLPGARSNTSELFQVCSLLKSRLTRGVQRCSRRTRSHSCISFASLPRVSAEFLRDPRWI